MSRPPIALEDRESQDGRLFSPSAGRNKAVIANALSAILPQGASVFELGSGTGEHGITVLQTRPDVQWQFSDPDAESRASQQAWIDHVGITGPAPLDIDASESDWPLHLTQKYDALFSANMIHIAPPEALFGIAAAAAKVLKPEGQVVFYGPFLFGAASAPSNLAFDASLKARNPVWGVRESDFVKHIFAKAGFNRAELRDMPKNNHLFILSRP